MHLRAILYLVFGLILVILADIANTRLGWSIDIAWLLVAAAAFAYPPEVGAIAGLLFGLTLDGLSGTGTPIYTLAYGGFGTVLVGTRKAFYLKGLLPGWILAVVGAEALWLFLGMYCRAIVLLGGAARVPGLLSPFLVSVVVGYPFVYWLARLVLAQPGESSRVRRFGSAVSNF